MTTEKLPHFFTVNIEMNKELLSSRPTSFCKKPILNLKEGENLLRILPPWSDRGVIFKALYLHWFGNKNNRIAVLCLSRNFREPCFICQTINEIQVKGLVPIERIKNYLATKRAFCNALDLADLSKGVQIVSLPVTQVATKLVNLLSDPEYGDFTHPTQGYNIKIIKITKGLFPEYSIVPARTSSPLPNFKFLEELYDLDDFENIWVKHSYEEQRDFWMMYSDLLLTPVEPSIDDDDDLLSSTGNFGLE